MLARLVELCAKNRFLVIVLVALATAAGVWAVFSVPLDAIPDLSDVQVIIQTDWSGRSPDLIEAQVTYPIVTSLLGAPKTKVVRGYSYFGLSLVSAIFEDGTDLYWARSRVLEYISQLQSEMPEGAKLSLGPDATGVGWVYQYALVDKSGENDLADLRAFQDFHLRYWLESVPGVAEVATVGGFERTYQVLIDPDRLAYHGVSLEQLIMAIRASNNDVGGRVIELSGREFMVRGRGYIDELDDLRQIAIRSDSHGTPLLLGDVAEIAFGPDMRRGIAELNGEGEVVGGIVIMRTGENALDVINAVKEKIEEVRPSLPEGVELVTTYDRSKLIEGSIETLVDKLLEEIIIVSIVVLLFLFHFRSALVVIIALPIAIVVSFIPMLFLKVTSNVMSLGGIAIAIGVMVDAAIVMVENAHRRLSLFPDRPRREVIIEAASQMGRPLFFSLLIVAVSFLPIFVLEAQEGRLFKPLAYAKTFAMFFAAFLSVTLVPVLAVWFIRGKIRPERKNPLTRGLKRVYRPLMRGVLRHKGVVIAGAALAILVTIPVLLNIGSEFMPPLNEGTILYMPTTLPGISMTEAGRLLQTQDRLFMTFPEVDTVFGKIGRAETATDPAPMTMVETTVVLKPKEEWREGMTWDKLIAELDEAFQFPGMTNAWTMPIKTRIDMLTTGIKTPVGIKIMGPDLEEIARIGTLLESVLAEVEGTRSVYAERVTGGNYIDIIPNRAVIARYGLRVEDVLRHVEMGIGGMSVDETVEGPERFSINIRYFRDYRDNLEDLEKILIATPSGAQVPLGQLAEITMVTGPAVIKNEDGSLSGWVYVDLEDRDPGSYIADAKRAVEEKVHPHLKSGYYLKWAGQYEFMERVNQRLLLIVPLTVLIIFVLLYIVFKDPVKSLIVLGFSVPFAMVGGIWLVSLMGYNMSIAVWVGLIAVAGVTAETSVVMLVFLEEAFKKYESENKPGDLAGLRKALIEGAVARVRPMMMTFASTFLGLMPILWSTGTGADMMKRIATPMVGGMFTDVLMTLLVIPAAYYWWRGRGLRRNLSAVPAIAPTSAPDM